MAKKKKVPKKRNLKYGQVISSRTKAAGNIRGVSESAADEESGVQFKKELRKNLMFLAGFFIVLFVIYFLVARTSLLDPVLSIFGLKGLY